jgi:hypothetical protein
VHTTSPLMIERHPVVNGTSLIARCGTTTITTRALGLPSGVCRTRAAVRHSSWTKKAFRHDDENIVERIRSEYTEMPGMRLSAAQVERFCGVDRLLCGPVLDAPVDANFLCRDADGTYTQLRSHWRIGKPKYARCRHRPRLFTRMQSSVNGFPYTVGAPLPRLYSPPMGTPLLSEDLNSEFQSLRRNALELHKAVTSTFLKQRIEMALLDLDEIPRLFDSEEYMRQALIVPRARINEVARAVERFGANAESVDLG